MLASLDTRIGGYDGFATFATNLTSQAQQGGLQGTDRNRLIAIVVSVARRLGVG
ncbi:MAG: hypothetical protein ACR2PF_10975 [Rhizobiaceae bacterium]